MRLCKEPFRLCVLYKQGKMMKFKHAYMPQDECNRVISKIRLYGNFKNSKRNYKVIAIVWVGYATTYINRNLFPSGCFFITQPSGKRDTQ